LAIKWQLTYTIFSAINETGNQCIQYNQQTNKQWINPNGNEHIHYTHESIKTVKTHEVYTAMDKNAKKHKEYTQESNKIAKTRGYIKQSQYGNKHIQ
jgi:hypothetical protein